MKGKKAEESRGYKRLTIGRLREFPGLENLSDSGSEASHRLPGKVIPDPLLLPAEIPKLNHYNVSGFFGGTYESTKTDERNEFNRMIRFVKNQKEGVSVILVYSLDRFSRTGDNAIFISSERKKRDISILSVTQSIDVSTHSGVLQHCPSFEVGISFAGGYQTQ